MGISLSIPIGKTLKGVCALQALCRKMLLIGNGPVFTRDNELPYLKNGAIAIENGSIIEVGSFDSLQARYPDAELLDAKGKIIMPGLINAHEHIYSTFARGMSLDGKPNTNFLEILEGLWWRLDKALTIDDIRYSAYITLLDGVRYGVTTVYDHHASPNAVQGSLFTIADVAKEIGIRTSLAYEVSDRDGLEVTKAGIKENMEFIKYANHTDQDMVRGMFGLHAAFTLSDESLQMCAEAMAGENAGYHVHVAEGIEDVWINLDRYGKRPAERLNDFGMLSNESLAVHCIYLNKTEIETLKRNKTNLAHNPESNMGNAVGCSPVIHYMQEGLRVCLGTDGYTHDIMESVKVANIIHKHNLSNPTVAWGEVPQMAYSNNPALVEQHFGIRTGILQAGAKGDVILVDYDPRTPLNENNLNSHILFGMMGKSVTHTIINGKVIMKDRIIQTVDEERIFSESRQAAERLWKRA